MKMILKDLMLREVGQTRRDKYCRLALHETPGAAKLTADRK